MQAHSSNQNRWLWVYLGLGGVVAALVTGLSIAGFTGHGLKEREFAQWTQNADGQILAEQQNYAAVSEIFGDYRHYCLLVVECDDFFQPERWLALESAVAELSSTNGVVRVFWAGSVPEFSRDRADISVEELSWPLNEMVKLAMSQWEDVPTPESSLSEWNAFGDRVRAHPFVDGRLISSNGQTLLLQVAPYAADETLLQYVRTRGKELLEPHGMHVRMTGDIPLWHAHDKAFDRSHYQVMGLALGVSVVLAILIFRDPRSLILVGVGPALGGFWAIGIVNWLGEPHNELTDMILPVMLTMVGFTDTVHLVIDIRREKARGETPLAAAISAMRRVGPACVLTSITTAIGFATLMLSDSEVISSFGRSSAIAVMVMLVAIAFATPVFAVLLRGPGVSKRQRRLANSKNADAATAESGSGTLLQSVLRLPSRHPRMLTAMGLLLTVAFGLAASRLQPDDRKGDRMPHTDEAWQAFAHCDETFGGTQFIKVIVTWYDDVDETRIAAVINQVSAAMDDEELIANPMSVLTWMQLIPNRGDSQPPLMFASLLPEEVRGLFYKPELGSALVVANVQDKGLIVYEPVLGRVRDRLAAIQQQNPGFELRLTGEPILESRIVRHVVIGLFQSLLTTAVCIFLTLTIAFRSLRLGLISIIPNTMPLLAAATFRSCFGQSLDIASACALIIALGIAVDDTIHLIWRFQYEFKIGGTSASIVERTVLGVGKPLTMTTIIMVLGIASVITSELPTHRFFGWIACTTLTVAWLADLILLPAMLSWLAKPRRASAKIEL